MFNIKTLVAVAALAVAGTASAKVLDPIGTVNGGEMFLSLWSESAEVSFIFDTGIMINDFRTQAAAPGFKYEVDLSSNTEYQNFVSIAGAATDVKFAFIGGDNSGNPAAARTMISTISADDAVTVTNGDMVLGMSQIQANFLSAVNLDPRIQASANASATFQKGSGGNAYWGEVMGDDLFGKFKTVTAAKGSSIGIYDFVRSSTSGGGDATEVSLGNNPQMNATYAGNTFTVTAVPEPESYALMIAGLGAMGLVAARRRAAK